jgi:hypothetical protein
MTSRRDGGQSVIEALAIVPLLLAGALTAGQLLATGICRELAGHAAEAGAAAILQGSDPIAAARRSLPGWSRGRLRIERDGRRVVVHVQAPELVPGLAARLTGRVAADAGPTG